MNNLKQRNFEFGFSLQHPSHIIIPIKENMRVYFCILKVFLPLTQFCRRPLAYHVKQWNNLKKKIKHMLNKVSNYKAYTAF